MKGKILGIFGLLVALCVYMVFETSDPWWNISTSSFIKLNNIENLLRRISLFGILGIGVAFVIITSGIDLSIGSMVCLSGVLLATFLQVTYVADAEFNVVSLTADTSTIVVEGVPPDLQPGSRIRYSGGNMVDSQIFTVESVSSDNGTSSLVFQEKVRRDESAGQVTPTSQIVELERFLSEKNLDRELSQRAGDQSSTEDEAQQVKLSLKEDDYGAKVVMMGVHELKPRDRILLVSGRSVKDEEIVSAEPDQQAGQTTVWIRNDPGKSVDLSWAAIHRLRRQRMSVPAALLLVLAIGAVLGCLHGLLITRAHLQPFVVTLCGLLIYRGVSRWMTGGNAAGFNEYADDLCVLGHGKLDLFSYGDGSTFGIPYPFFVFAAVAILASILLSRTIWGRYLLALGRNEEAARFSGINTKRLTAWAYVICTMLAAVGGMLFALSSLSVSPSSFGNFYELYAIAAAVLGGCSLRGGEGSVIGVILGTAVMQVLNNLILMVGISQELEFAVIGAVILIGVLADEVLKKIITRHRLKKRLQ
jgi:ribose transport system permease protein